MTLIKNIRILKVIQNYKSFSTCSMRLIEHIEGKIKVDNMMLRYKMEGNGSRVVLCLPGIIGTIETDYGAIFNKIDKEQFTIVSWDPPGYGQSRPPNRNFAGDFYHRDAHLVAELMENLNLPKYSILGWSNGGITGCHLASDYPTKIEKLITWGSHSFADERAVQFSKMMSDLSLWSDKMKAPLLRIYDEEYLLKMLKEWGQSVQEYYNDGSDQLFKEAITKIKCPTLIIHGELDPVLGIEHAEFLHRFIKGARLHVMTDGKHNLHLRFTDEFLKLVGDFLLE